MSPNKFVKQLNPETADIDEEVINKSPTWFMLLKTWIWMATITSPFFGLWMIWVSAETIENRNFRNNGGRYTSENALADKEKQHLTDDQQTQMILDNRATQLREFKELRDTQTELLEITNRIDERVQTLMKKCENL